MAGHDTGTIRIEIAYAESEEVELVTMQVPAGTTVMWAIVQSGILERNPSIDPASMKTGIFSRYCTKETLLRNGDRIEIYRPLTADPKDTRRNRARKQRATGRSQ